MDQNLHCVKQWAGRIETFERGNGLTEYGNASWRCAPGRWSNVTLASAIRLIVRPRRLVATSQKGSRDIAILTSRDSLKSHVRLLPSCSIH